MLIRTYAIISVSDILLDVAGAIFILLSKGGFVMTLYEIASGVFLALGLLVVLICILRNGDNIYDDYDDYEDEDKFNGNWW